jgi:osmotically-inducible protein OsmY
MRGTPISDQSITNQVNRKLASRGVGSPCRVTVDTKHGQVTLSGSVRFAHQKSAAASAVKGITGVRRVVDNLVVKSQPVR